MTRIAAGTVSCTTIGGSLPAVVPAECIERVFPMRTLLRGSASRRGT